MKVTDFGIARASGTPQLTAAGLVLGSLHYMSPEQIKAQPVDPRSDLYSVGVTLYEILTGCRPFEGATEYEIMRAHLETKPIPPERRAPRMGPKVSEAILRALGKDPAERFQDAQEFRTVLGLAIASSMEAPEAKSSSPTSGHALAPDDVAAIQANLIPYLGPSTRAPARQSGVAYHIQRPADPGTGGAHPRTCETVRTF